MSDFYQNYTEGPSNNPNRGDRGTAPMVLGLISLICSLTFSRLAGIQHSLREMLELHIELLAHVREQLIDLLTRLRTLRAN